MANDNDAITEFVSRIFDDISVMRLDVAALSRALREKGLLTDADLERHRQALIDELKALPDIPADRLAQLLQKFERKDEAPS